MAQYVWGAENFFDALKRAELTNATQLAVQGAVHVLLEDDDDNEGLAPPDFSSFDALLTFLRWHPELPVPALGLSPAGLFTASWQDAGFKLEFQPARKVRWVRTAKVVDRIEVSDGPADLESVRLPDSLRRAAA